WPGSCPRVRESHQLGFVTRVARRRHLLARPVGSAASDLSEITARRAISSPSTGATSPKGVRKDRLGLGVADLPSGGPAIVSSRSLTEASVRLDDPAARS